MLAVRHSTQADRVGRIRVPRPTGDLDGSARRRCGLTLIEFLLVFATIVCVLVGAQCWNELQPHMQPGVVTQTRLAGEDVSPISDVAIAPNQRDAVSVGMDGHLRFHDLGTQSCWAEAPSKTRESRSVCYSPDGSRLLVSSRDGHVELWSLTDSLPTSRTVLTHVGEVTHCQFSPDGAQFLTCGDDRRCVIWDVKSLSPVFELPGVTATVRRACFFADGTQLLTGDINGHLQLWNLKTRQLIKQFNVSGPALSYKTFVEGMALLSGQSEVIVALRGGGIRVWDLESGHLLRSFQHNGRDLTSLTVSSDGSRAVSGSVDGQLDVWDIATGTCLQSFAGHNGPVQALNITSDRRLAVSSGWDGQLRFWEI